MNQNRTQNAVTVDEEGREGKTDGGRDGGREGWMDGWMEGGREGGGGWMD